MADTTDMDLRSRRIERSESWIDQARKSKGSMDISFICLWIAFNALYDYEDENFERVQQRKRQQRFFRKLIDYDTGGLIYGTVLMRLDSVIGTLIQNKHVFEPYWEARNDHPNHADWKRKFARSKRQFNIAKDDQDTAEILYHVFDRLYTLRNQVVHGGATHGSVRNRDSIRGGCDILTHLVPVFVDIVKKNPGIELGQPYYYVDT